MKINKFMPLLNLYIELPFFQARTSLLCKRYEMRTTEIVTLFVRIWKWKFDFELYERDC